MKPIETRITNAIIPGGGGGHPLPVHRTERGELMSFWRLTEDEVEAILEGGDIVLVLTTDVHPPVAMFVTDEQEGGIVSHSEDAHGAPSHAAAALVSLCKRILTTWAHEGIASTERKALTDEFLDLLIDRGAEEIKAYHAPAGLTVRQLREWVARIPDRDGAGEEREVWMMTGQGISSPVTMLSPLNASGDSCDMLIGRMEE